MSDCLLWAGTIDSKGYGIYRPNRRVKPQKAHRVMYEILVGPIPEGLVIDHLCRNRRCVNPEHLEPVSMHENIMRGNGTFAVNARKTHCIHGHEFTPENTYFKNGKHPGRQCRKCIAASNARRYERKKAA